MSEAISESDAILLANFMAKRKELLMQKQISKGLKTSGKSAELLRTEAEGNTSKLIDGTGSFEFQEFGRAPGSPPPFQALYDWLEFQKYGIHYENDDQRKGIAYALQKKIAEKGTHTYITGSPTGVLTEALNQEVLDELMVALANKKTKEIKSDVLRIFKQ